MMNFLSSVLISTPHITFFDFIKFCDFTFFDDGNSTEIICPCKKNSYNLLKLNKFSRNKKFLVKERLATWEKWFHQIKHELIMDPQQNILEIATYTKAETNGKGLMELELMNKWWWWTSQHFVTLNQFSSMYSKVFFSLPELNKL